MRIKLPLFWGSILGPPFWEISISCIAKAGNWPTSARPVLLESLLIKILKYSLNS